MSTIEEAREQAREALAARLTGDIFDAVPDDNDMQHVLELAASELRGPRPITDERPMSEKEAIWEETTKRLLELHGPVEIEPCETICGQCSFQLPNGAYFGKVEEWPCPTVRVLQSGAEARR